MSHLHLRVEVGGGGAENNEEGDGVSQIKTFKDMRFVIFCVRRGEGSG